MKGVGLQLPGQMLTPSLSVVPTTRTRWRTPSLNWPQDEWNTDDELTAPLPLGERDRAAAIVLVIDDSASTKITDPDNRRYRACRRLLRGLSDGLGGRAHDDLLGVVHFSAIAQPWLRLTSVCCRRGRDAVRQALVPTRGGNTALVPALHRAAALLDEAGERLPVCLLFTDGESEETSQDLAAAAGPLVSSFHVIVLGDLLPEQWSAVPCASVSTVNDLVGTESLEWPMARGLYAGLGLDWPGGS